MEWTFQTCFSIPREVAPSAFDLVSGNFGSTGVPEEGAPKQKWTLRDVRVVPRDPTEEDWSDWCVQGRLEADEMSDEDADQLAWEAFSVVAYDRISDVFQDNDWMSGDITRVGAAPRHAWGIPRQDNDPIHQLRQRLLPPR